MSNAAYSDLKVVWHGDRLASLRAGEQVVPLQVHFIISDLCNHNCHFCAYRMDGGFSTEQFADGLNRNPNRMIPVEKCLEILDDMAELGVKAVQFTGGGEPTCHPDHLQIFEHALNLGLECGLVTNGYILKPGWEVILPRFKWVRVSVDAGTSETYSRVRGLPQAKKGRTALARTLGNISLLSDAIERQGSDCLLGLGYVITNENFKELPSAVEMLSETGAAYVRLSAMFSDQGSEYYNGNYNEIHKLIQHAKEYESDDFGVVDLFGERIEDLDLGEPDYPFCAYQQLVCYIGGNQKVYRCCTTSYTAHGEIGDLTNQRFRVWFKSQAKQAAIDSLDARSCQTCQFNGKNKTVNYMLDGEPTHVNFV